MGALFGGMISDIILGDDNPALQEPPSYEHLALEEENRRIELMYVVFRNQFCQLAEEYLLTKSDFTRIASSLKDRDLRDILLKMYEVDNKVSFVACLVKPFIYQIIRERIAVYSPNEDDVFEETHNLLCANLA